MPEFLTLNVFTRAPHAGNQLAVVFNAGVYTDEEMLGVARDFNYSETTFVSPPAGAGHVWGLRIFTPGGEIPFAGHPTIGSAIAMIQQGAVAAAEGENEVVLQEGVGLVPVSVWVEKGVPIFARMSVPMLPQVQELEVNREALAELLGIAAVDLLDEPYSPQVLSCGIPFLFVPVRSHEVVARSRVRQELWKQTLGGTPGANMMIFAMNQPGASADVHARVFVPGYGIPEDPATGSACAALGGYLAGRTPRNDTTLRWVVEQGVEMGRPSRIEVEVDKQGGSVVAVRVGGSAVVTSRGSLMDQLLPTPRPKFPRITDRTFALPDWSGGTESYPIGPYVPEEVTEDRYVELLEEISFLPDQVQIAVAGWGAEELDAPYRVGGWTVRQLLHHLADSHTNAYVRTRLALTEDSPTIRPYDEKLWAELYDARTASIEDSLSLLDALHGRWTKLLRSYDLETLRTRGYDHPESGYQSLDQVVHHYAWHGRHHLAHILRAGELFSLETERYHDSGRNFRDIRGFNLS